MRVKIQVLVAVLAGGLITAAVALAASSPSVVTGAATKVADNSAQLNGTVNPNGNATTYYFQWGLTTSYGVNGKPHSAGSGAKVVSVKETAGGLIPGTAYHYRLVATNRYGTTVGSDHTFTTAGHPPPNATTGPASGLSTTGATLTGVISPNGQDTSYTFEYGLTTSYGFETYGGVVKAGSSPVNVATVLQGLAPGKIFHYRLVAAHSNSPTTYGADGTFMTYPSPRPVPRIHARTSPHRDRRRPFVFTTSGHVGHPAWIPAIYACTGDVEVLYFNGARHAGSTLTAVQPDCAFSASTTFRHLPRRHHGKLVSLRVEVRFLGNSYLAPHRAPRKSVNLG